MPTPPTVLQFRVSHYNEKVRWALDLKRWPHRRQTLLPAFHLPRTLWCSGQSKLPVLLLDGRALADSTRIIAELERLRPEPPLYPADAKERERALALEDWFDEEVAPEVRRLFWSTYLDRDDDCVRMSTDGAGPWARGAWRAALPVLRPLLRRRIGLSPRQVAAARARLPGFFDRLEAELSPRGYLVGDRFTIADLTAAAVMTAIIRPPQFSYPLPEPWAPGLVELRDGVAHREGFRWVLDVYARHRGASSELTG